VHYFNKRNKLTSNRSDDNCQLVDQLVANLTTAYLQHLTMYCIYMQSYLLLIGYCFVARRRSAISLSSTSTSCCFSSALLRRAIAFVTSDNSPLFSHFSCNSFEVERREETSVFNRLHLPSNSCIASVSFLFLFHFSTSCSSFCWAK